MSTQGEEGGRAVVDMPKPGEEHRRMERLVGRWEGEDVHAPSPWNPKGSRAQGRMNARMALAGLYLILDWTEEKDGRVHFEGHGVLGWDPRGRCYTMHWFDSSGVEHGAPHLGTWEGNALALQHETSHMGHSRQVYEFGEGQYRFMLQASTDGRDWTTVMEGLYRRSA